MSELPSFGSPPVVEVALGVQFRPLAGLQSLRLSPLRERWRPDYPRVEDHPPLPPVTEANISAGTPSLQLTLGDSPKVRHWFISESGADLVQLQQDRMIVNWRRGDPPTDYPRYSRMRAVFVDRARDLATFVAAERMGELQINQVELNYINAIELPARHLGQLEFVLESWSGLPEHHLGDPEEARVSLAFRVPGLGREPSRLYVSADPAIGPDGGQILFLAFTVRGAAAGPTLEAALAFMDAAHEHAVRSFDELTTEPMHSTWGRHT